MLILESAFSIVLPLVLGGTALALLPWTDSDIARTDAAVLRVVRDAKGMLRRWSSGTAPLVQGTVRS